MNVIIQWRADIMKTLTNIHTDTLMVQWNSRVFSNLYSLKLSPRFVFEELTRNYIMSVVHSLQGYIELGNDKVTSLTTYPKLY